MTNEDPDPRGKSCLKVKKIHTKLILNIRFDFSFYSIGFDEINDKFNDFKNFKNM